jgi:FkbM family methyltransferase
LNLKSAIRHKINSNPTTRKLFVAFCARFAMRLYALQRYLSVEGLKGKFRTSLWRFFLTTVEKLPLQRIVIANGLATFFYKNGCAFHVSKNKHSNSNCLFLDPEYEKNETNLIKRLVQPDWIAIDIGANFGWYSILLSSLVGPKGKVIAFEPVPESYLELSSNAKLNECDNLKTFQMAAGNESGFINMYIPEIEFGGGAASQFLDIGAKIQVPVVRLDDFLNLEELTRVDFFKIDVEGGELNTLRGAEKLFRKFRPQILIEIVDVHCQRFGNTHEDVIGFLTKLGYTGRYINEAGELIAIDPYHPLNGNYLFSAR